MSSGFCVLSFMRSESVNSLLTFSWIPDAPGTMGMGSDNVMVSIFAVAG